MSPEHENHVPDVADANRVHIFDTTLRDGEQSPGCSMNTAEKLEVAQALVDLGVVQVDEGGLGSVNVQRLAKFYRRILPATARPSLRAVAKVGDDALEENRAREKLTAAAAGFGPSCEVTRLASRGCRSTARAATSMRRSSTMLPARRSRRPPASTRTSRPRPAPRATALPLSARPWPSAPRRPACRPSCSTVAASCSMAG
mgnify:CR=1 FL=1